MNMKTVLVADLYAQNSVVGKTEFQSSGVPVLETALEHANMKKLSARSDSGLGVTLLERPVTGLLTLRAREGAGELSVALQSVLQLELPDKLGSVSGSHSGATTCVRWMAPDEWLLSCAIEHAFEIEQAIRDAVGGASVAVVNVSGGFTALELYGPSAQLVLRKSTPYDVHPVNFVPAKVVNTVLAKAQVCLRCIDGDHYELIVRRSFADYVWHWLQVAAAEYGLSIAVVDTPA